MRTPDLQHQLVRDGAPPPDELLRFARTLRVDAVVTPLWRNGLGGWTVRLDPRRGEADPTVLKWVPAATLAAHPAEPTPSDEAARLSWIAGVHPVPRLLDHGTDPESGAQWMLTAAIEGTSAVSDRWRADPRTAVRALGEGLRALHEALPVESCPWRFGPPSPAAEDTVVCHGDSCAPNTLLDERGAWLAHVDLGLLGVGDRWLDLAVGAQSLAWNYGPGWEADYFAAYGITPQHDRLESWQRWWNDGGSDHADSEP